jgi:PilZ domain
MSYFRQVPLECILLKQLFARHRAYNLPFKQAAATGQREETMEERRQYERVAVNYHANGYDCTVEIEGKYYSARLMDISAGGARLKLSDAPAYHAYGMYGTVKDDYYGQPYLKGVNYTVAWHNDYEMGISFAQPLAREADALYSYYSSNA